MTLARIVDILRKAQSGGYAVGALNADNLEMVQAFVRAAEKVSSPLILQVSLGAIQYSGLESVANIALFEAQRSSVPVAVHLDHVKDLQKNILALRAGVGSLCMDAADLPFERNIQLTGEVARLAHTAGLEVEAGIGYVPDYNEALPESQRMECMTKVDEAARFIEQTQVDLLAISIGSMRGMDERVINLDINRLNEIRKKVNVPLVLHGASGVTWESIQEAIQHGICKINIASTFDEVFIKIISEELARHPDEINFRKIFKPAKEAVVEAACEIFQKLRSANKI